MVDPVTGAVRTTVVAAAGDGDVSVVGGSALVAGGPTLYLFASVQDDDGTREVLAEVDVGSGRTVVDRDLDEDVAAASRYPVGRRSADDRRVRHPARAHPAAVVPGPVSRTGTPIPATRPCAGGQCAPRLRQ
jgi:hypothetical protein